MEWKRTRLLLVIVKVAEPRTAELLSYWCTSEEVTCEAAHLSVVDGLLLAPRHLPGIDICRPLNVVRHMQPWRYFVRLELVRIPSFSAQNLPLSTRSCPNPSSELLLVLSDRLKRVQELAVSLSRLERRRGVTCAYLLLRSRTLPKPRAANTRNCLLSSCACTGAPHELQRCPPKTALRRSMLSIQRTRPSATQRSASKGSCNDIVRLSSP